MTDAERRAFLALVRVILGDEHARRDLDPAHLPLDVVRRHLLAPIAHTVGVAAFARDHIASSLLAERRAVLLGEITDALAGEGIGVILLKGVAYAGTIYADPAERPMSDIDLLVPADSFDRASAVVRRLGYWHAGGAHQLAPTHHAVTYKRRDSALDLHRHLVHGGRTQIDMSAVWRDAIPSHVPGARRPMPAHEYLLHVAHIARHELIVPVINFVDAVRLRTDDGVTLAHAWRLVRACEGVDSMTRQLLGDESTSRAWEPAIDEVIAGHSPRAIQIARKILYMDQKRDVLALGWSAFQGFLLRRGVRVR
jgi:hypothetical protein